MRRDKEEKGRRIWTAFQFVLLAVLLVAALPPAPAQAEDSSVCRIGSSYYSSLDNALAAVKSGEMITLLDNIDYTSPIIIDGIAVTFNLNGHTLNAEVSSGNALTVLGGGKVDYVTGKGGAFNVKTTAANAYAVYATGKGSQVRVNSATAGGDASCGAFAGPGGAVGLSGNIVVGGSHSTGASADGGMVTLSAGDIVVSSDHSMGAYATNQGSITVNNGSLMASGANTYGAYAEVGSAGPVTGGTMIYVARDLSVNGAGSFGAYAKGLSASVVVGGSITVGEGGYNAASAGKQGSIGVNGDVTSPHSPAYAWDGGWVRVQGNATAINTYQAVVYSQGGNIDIRGNVTASGPGGVGVEAGAGVSPPGWPAPMRGSSVFVGGIISADQYIRVGGVSKAPTDMEEAVRAEQYIRVLDMTIALTDKGAVVIYDGYNLYTDGTSKVWVKMSR